MYEELVKRLRTECALPYSTIKDMRDAADVIETLSKKRNAACWGCRCQKLELSKEE